MRPTALLPMTLRLKMMTAPGERLLPAGQAWAAATPMKRLLTTLAVTLSGMTCPAFAESLGDIQSWKQDANTVTIVCGTPVVRLEFWAEDVVRVTLSPDGKFHQASKHDVPLVLEGCYGEPPSIQVADGDTLSITTKRMTLRVDKKPFRLHFLREDGTTLITRNPEGATLDTGLTAFFEPDAAGAKEHLFGAGEKAKDGCDLRGRSFVCYDHWGNGCPAPFVMSTAGYGLFVNSALGEHIGFDLRGGDTPFSLSVGMGREGVPSRLFMGEEKEQDLDFFLLYGPGFEHIIDRFTTLTGKPPLLPKPVFGLSYHTRTGGDTQTPGGFARFREEGYPIDGCITFINRSWNEKNDDQVRKVSDAIHDMNGWVVGYLDSTDSYVGMLMDTDFPYRQWAPYREHLTERLFKQGIDSIYMDELEGRGTMFQLRALKETYDAMSRAYPGRRAVVLARGGFTGCQRYAYWWMGDTGPHAGSARSTVRAQLGHGLAGLPLTTHDLGGYTGPGSKAGCVRGAQLNFLQPMAHLNCYRSKGEPWSWDKETEEIFMKFDRLHYRLLPYWYSCAWQAHTTGMPVWRHLVFSDSAYYDKDAEFMVGDWLYFAPVLDEGTSRPVFIPKGRWIDYFTGQVFDGPSTIESYEVPLDRTPLFVKAGAIIPMGPEQRHVNEKPGSPLTLDLYPYGCPESHHVLYEDDGISTKYLEGESCTTPIEMREGQDGIAVVIQPRQGGFTPPNRDFEVLLHGIKSKPARIFLNGKPLEAGYDGKLELLRLSFPDTGGGQKLDIQR
jgi:alpha-glucosidase